MCDIHESVLVAKNWKQSTKIQEWPSTPQWSVFPPFEAAVKFLQHQQYKTRHHLKTGSLWWRLSNNYLTSDVMKVDEREWNTVWTQNRASNLLMNMTSKSFPQFPGLSFPLLQKNLQCLMIPRTLGWAPTLINEPHLGGAGIPGDAVAKTVVLGNPGSPWWWVPVRIVFFFPPRWGAPGWTGKAVSLCKVFPPSFTVSALFLPRTTEFEYVTCLFGVFIFCLLCWQ